MHLSARTSKILRILARFPQNQPVTTAAISEELGLSRRSVLRELPAVERWLTAEGFRFVRKPGTGLFLDEDAARRAALLQLLGEDTADSRQERKMRLRRELLSVREPIKAYSFTERLGISEGTLWTELDHVAAWLENYQLRLIRRPGLGIFVEGEESDRRQAISAVICEQFGEQQLLTMLRGGHESAWFGHSEGSGKPDADVTACTEEVLAHCEEQLAIRFSDSAFISLFVHISLAMQRLRDGETITIEPERLQKLRILPEFAVAERMAARLREALHLKIPTAEVGFIAMHLSGASIWPGGQRDLTQTGQINVRQTVLAMMRLAGQSLGVDFSGDTVLLEDLCNHIGPTIGRLRARIPIENPQLDSLLADYPEVYKASECSAAVLHDLHEIADIPANEVGFIAMHFGAAIERMQNLLRRIAVVIVCPTGIGTSRLLAAGLTREFPHIDVRGVLSAFQLDPEKLRQEGVELIVSTTQLDTAFRYVRVNPMLTMQDKMLLGTELDALLLQKKDTPAPQVLPPQAVTRADVTYIEQLGRELYALLDHVCILQAPVLHSRAMLVRQAAGLFAAEDDARAGIAHVFAERNKLSDPYIRQFHALLLHGRTALVAHACFGYVRLEPPVYEDGRMLLGALVMLIPAGDRSTCCAQIMSEISGLLLEEPLLLDVLRLGDSAELRVLLEERLLQFYRRTVQTRLHLER